MMKLAAYNEIQIPATVFAPEVTFSPVKMKMKIAGESRMENAEKFYRPILDAVRDYLGQDLQDTGQFELHFCLSYFDTHTSKYLYDLLLEFSVIKHRLKVYWCYESDDEIIREGGYMLQEASDVSFEFVSLS